MTAASAEQDESYFARREECRKCDGEVWATYYFVDGKDAGWGCRPVGECGNPSRCGEKLQWLDDDDLALARVPMRGAA